MNPIICVHCGTELPAARKAALCPRCGGEVRAASGGGQGPGQRTCPKCNYVFAPFEDKCPRCGAKPAAEAKEDSRFRPVVPEGEEKERAEPTGPPPAPGPPRIGEEPARRPGPPRIGEEPARRPGPPPLDAQRPAAPPPVGAQGPAAPPPGGQRTSGDLKPLGGTARPAAASQPGPADAPWGEPPATSRERRGEVEKNTSGMHRGAPREITGWNWGAFFLTWIWGIAHNVWIALLAIPFGLIMAIVLGVKGSEWAWQNRRFASVEEFKQVQRIWGWVGLALFLVQLLVFGLWLAAAGLAILGGAASGLEQSGFQVR